MDNEREDTMQHESEERRHEAHAAAPLVPSYQCYLQGLLVLAHTNSDPVQQHAMGVRK